MSTVTPMKGKTIVPVMLIIILIGLSSTFLSIQLVRGTAPFVAKWEKAYGGTGDEEGKCIVNASDGGYLLGGYTTSFGAGNKDFWIVKVSASGDSEWNKTYGGTSDDVCTSIIPDVDGGYLLGGYTFSFGAGTKDIWLIKTDSTGNALWNKTYGWYEYEDLGAPESVAKTNDGGYVMAGTTRSHAVGGEDALLIKINSTGFIEWNKTYAGPNYDRFYTVLQTNDGGYMCGGWTKSYGEGTDWNTWNVWLVRTDSSGNALWNVTYGGSYDDYIWGMTKGDNDEYVFAGTFGYTGSSTGGWWFKINSSGNQIWNATDLGEGWAGTNSIIDTGDGGYALCGITGSSFVNSDVWLLKTNASGIIEWNGTYTGPGDDRAYSIISIADEGYMTAGSTNSFGSGGYDFLLVKFGPDVLAPEAGTPSLNPSRNNVQPYQNVTVSVNVTDSESKVKNVTLICSLDNGTTWENPVLMTLNATSDLYEGTIPGQPTGTYVRFKIEAFDNAGNNVTNDGTSFDYTYTVVPEFSQTLALPMFMIATLLSLIIYKRKKLSFLRQQ
jgi:hypothetical protein